jgi:hypothetical protein
MVLSAEIINVFLRVLQRLRTESNQRLEGLEEHAVDTISNYLAGLSSVRDPRLTQCRPCSWMYMSGIIVLWMLE